MDKIYVRIDAIIQPEFIEAGTLHLQTTKGKEHAEKIMKKRPNPFPSEKVYAGNSNCMKGKAKLVLVFPFFLVVAAFGMILHLLLLDD